MNIELLSIDWQIKSTTIPIFTFDLLRINQSALLAFYISFKRGKIRNCQIYICFLNSLPNKRKGFNL